MGFQREEGGAEEKKERKALMHEAKCPYLSQARPSMKCHGGPGLVETGAHGCTRGQGRAHLWLARAFCTFLAPAVTVFLFLLRCLARSQMPDVEMFGCWFYNQLQPSTSDVVCYCSSAITQVLAFKNVKPSCTHHPLPMSAGQLAVSIQWPRP